MEDNTAGSPTRKGQVWTHLSLTEIVRRLLARGVEISRKVTRRIMGNLGFTNRRLVKSMTLGPSRYRDEQFEHIHAICRWFRNRGNPIFSLDSKRKEQLGPMFRRGNVFASQAAEVWDHDLRSYADGEVVPHGIYDIARNKAHLNLNTGADTGEFACASLKWYWNEIAAEHYPDADSILLLCDCGGSNSYRSKAFKFHLCQLANEFEISIEVAHYPVHCSKYNPIERKVFPYVEDAWRGNVFSRVEDFAETARAASTSTGLEITSHIIEKHFTPVRQSKTNHDISDLPITYDEELPEYNYKIEPTKN